MDQQRLTYLFERHRRNRCTPQEQAELDEWYDSLDNPDFVPQYIEGTPEATIFVAEQTRQIIKRLNKGNRTRITALWAKIAAVLIVGLIIGYLVWPEQLNKSGNETIAATEPVSYNRYVTLADGSIVILSEGSSLQLADGFSKTNRVLILKGEAYFDVKHNASLPFVIQTGKVKTTVLGTAFNIKQASDSVSVTVTRGKVQVERDEKVLAVLVPGQQIATNDQTTVAELKKTDVEPVTAWMQAGLHFNNTTLADVLKQLHHRYNADVVIKTAGMEHCTVNVVTPFKGTEDLNTILDVVCGMLGAKYSSNQGKIEITGEPCKE